MSGLNGGPPPQPISEKVEGQEVPHTSTWTDGAGKPSFWRQVKALFIKNWIVILRHPILNLIRCLILPVFYAAFLSNARYLFANNGVYGEGGVKDLQALPDDLGGEKLVYYLPPDADPWGSRLLQATLQNAGLSQRNIRLVSLDDPDVSTHCPQNLNGFSECFAALVFTQIDPEAQILNYTLRGDFGYRSVDVDNPKNDDQQGRFLPIQWAVEASFVELVTGQLPEAPRIWEYTSKTQKEHDDQMGRSYMRGARDILVLGWVVAYILAVYHLPGRMASERASGLTELLTAQGCSGFARIVSWSLSICSAHIVVWILFGAIYGSTIMPKTNTGYLIVLFAVMGIMLVNWTMLVAAPFSRVPSLAAIISAGLLILWAVVGHLVGSKAGAQIVLVLILPPTFVVSAVRGIASFELAQRPTNLVRKSPDGDAPQIALFCMALVVIVVYPLLALLVERALFDVSKKKSGRKTAGSDVPSDVAVRISHLRKEYASRSGRFWRKQRIVAIEDLSLDIPLGEITCLLGRNGAAKSTTLYALARTTPITSGTIEVQPNLRLGLAGQKDVLWDDLTCAEHVRLWAAIKGTGVKKSDANNLLDRCDLEHKRRALSKSLSGGQKRKLQLACALAGGSDLLLLDEISSGLDPLSRRAIWNVVTRARAAGTTVILTTHFLDEADYLGDRVAVLQQPGKLLAYDTPVGLKTRPGAGFTVTVESAQADMASIVRQLQDQTGVPFTYRVVQNGVLILDTGSTDARDVQALAEALRSMPQDLQFQVGSTSLEDVFLELNTEKELSRPTTTVGDSSSAVSKIGDGEKFHEAKNVSSADPEASLPELNAGKGTLALSPGARRGKLRTWAAQAGTTFMKRLMVLRHSWLLTALGVLATLLLLCIPLKFLKDRSAGCAYVAETEELLPLSYPSAVSLGFQPAVLSFGDSGLQQWARTSLPAYTEQGDRDQWSAYLRNNMAKEKLGGAAFANATQQEEQIVAFEGTPRRNKGTVMLNLYSNSILQQLSPAQGNRWRITTNFQYIPGQDFRNTGASLKWLVFFGIGIAIWPAFAALYPTQEKVTLVRPNQYSNGASPVALWTGHLLFEVPSVLLIATVATIAFAAIGQFHGVGELWVCLVLYGLSATLYAFLFAVFTGSVLGAWAGVAIFNAITFLIYLIIYMCLLTFDTSSAATDHINLAHFVFGIVSPVPNIVRAAMVSTNSFNLLCDGLGGFTRAPMGSMLLFGGPITYMIIQGLLAFALVVWADSGYPRPAFLRRRSKPLPPRGDTSAGGGDWDADIADEKARVMQAQDALQVRELTKRYAKAKRPAVDDVTFGVDHGSTFALIGPNGAGKTTTLACIRGVEKPNRGDVLVEGASIVTRRNRARGALGVCPQVNAIDPQLTVRQHLWVYGRLKGVPSASLGRDIDVLLAGAGLTGKANEFASSLSGGNQRKLSLALALLGDRPVVLIDEFSSGVDPFSKREAWGTLRTLTTDRAVLMTTHSMEEVDALADRVGIIASKLLAVGTPSGLKARYATYEVHVSASDAERILAHLHEAGFERAQRSEDTNTRISVPSVGEGEVASLLAALREAGGQWTIHEASTETAFLSIVRGHRAREAAQTQSDDGGRRKWCCVGARR